MKLEKTAPGSEYGRGKCPVLRQDRHKIEGSVAFGNCLERKEKGSGKTNVIKLKLIP